MTNEVPGKTTPSAHVQTFLFHGHIIVCATLDLPLFPPSSSARIQLYTPRSPTSIYFILCPNSVKITRWTTPKQSDGYNAKCMEIVLSVNKYAVLYHLPDYCIELVTPSRQLRPSRGGDYCIETSCQPTNGKNEYMQCNRIFTAS